MDVLQRAGVDEQVRVMNRQRSVKEAQTGWRRFATVRKNGIAGTEGVYVRISSQESVGMSCSRCQQRHVGPF